MDEGFLSRPFVVCRFSSIGDIVLSSGPLLYWHRARGLSFIYVTREKYAPLLYGHPAVEKALGLSEEQLSGRAFAAEAARLAGEYQENCLLDLHRNLRSRILAGLWRGPLLKYPKAGLLRRAYLRTGGHLFKLRLERYNVPQRYSLAIEVDPPPLAELRPRIFLEEREKERARDMLRRFTGPAGRSGPLLALHPYAAHPAKTWSSRRWLELAGLITARGWDFFIVGQGRPLLPKALNDFTGKTALRETCALLSQADLLITGDSGPMHMAGAVDCPVLAMFGPTVRAWGFQPFGPRDRVLELDLPCRPCTLHGRESCRGRRDCLEGISPARVLEQAAEMLAGN